MAEVDDSSVTNTLNSSLNKEIEDSSEFGDGTSTDRGILIYVYK